MTDVTRILQAVECGETASAEELFPLVYDELRRLAKSKMQQEPPGHTLQATALVHEAYVRLVKDGRETQWQNRRHFFAAAAEAMRRILVESARRKRRIKHGGGHGQVEFEEPAITIEPPREDVLALDEALVEFERVEPRKAELVKLRYFAGLSEEEAARSLGVSRPTASRWWSYARAWLFDRIGHG